jgi:hypothetical protein
MLVTGGCSLGAIFVLNCGAGIFFKNKEFSVTQLAAQYGAQLIAQNPNTNPESEIKSYVEALMPVVGLKPNNLNVKVEYPATFTPVGGKPQTGISVSVSNGFPLFGNGTVLPLEIQLSDTEFAGLAGGAGGGGGSPLGYCNVYICGPGAGGIIGQPFNNGNPGNFYVPIYNFPNAQATGKAPNGLPAMQQTMNLTGPASY